MSACWYLPCFPCAGCNVYNAIGFDIAVANNWVDLWCDAADHINHFEELDVLVYLAGKDVVGQKMRINRLHRCCLVQWICLFALS